MYPALPLAFGRGSPVFVNRNASIFNGIICWSDAFALNIRRCAWNKAAVENIVGSYSIVTCSSIIFSHCWLTVVGPIRSVTSSTVVYIPSVTVCCRILFFKAIIDFSLGRVVLYPPTIRWVNQVFLKFF